MSVCARCGHDPSCGFATIGTRHYCHDDHCVSTHAGLTCYVLSLAEMTLPEREAMMTQVRTDTAAPIFDADEMRRGMALALAIDSHGAVPGKESDECFVARASVFEAYLRGES